MKTKHIGLKSYYMKKIAFLFAFGSVFLAGCPKHEIIPAPVPEVELDGHFEGTINGTPVEFTENVSGFFVEATRAKIILPPPDPSSAIYYSNMKSSESLVSVMIGLGSIHWDASLSSEPSLNQFNAFFLMPANLTPAYTLGAADGFEVTYRDGSGQIWKSEPGAGSVTFSNIVQESDASGDYSKFTCTFSCTVSRTVGPDTFTLDIEDAVFDGWFKR